MRFSLTILVVNSIIGICFAETELVSSNDLVKRQNGAFIPSSTSTTCAANLKCGTEWCLRPGRGDLCCSEGYACPSTSYCLTKGYCCPLGLTIEQCAINNKVSLPAGFNTATVPAGAAVSGVSSSAAGVSLPSTAPRSSTGITSRSSASSSASSRLSSTTSSVSAFAGGFIGRTSSSSSTAAVATGGANVVKQAAEGLVMAAIAVGYLV